jgi:hypothetical protein
VVYVVGEILNSPATSMMDVNNDEQLQQATNETLNKDQYITGAIPDQKKAQAKNQEITPRTMLNKGSSKDSTEFLTNYSIMFNTNFKQILLSSWYKRRYLDSTYIEKNGNSQFIVSYAWSIKRIN